MDNERSLEEYILSQDGIIFRGTYKYPVALPWNFGQVPTPTLTHPASPHCTDTQASSVPEWGHHSGSDNRKMSLLMCLMGTFFVEKKNLEFF